MPYSFMGVSEYGRSLEVFVWVYAWTSIDNEFVYWVRYLKSRKSLDLVFPAPFELFLIRLLSIVCSSALVPFFLGIIMIHTAQEPYFYPELNVTKPMRDQVSRQLEISSEGTPYFCTK